MEYQDLCICLENEAILGIFKNIIKQEKINSDFVNKLISRISSFLEFNSTGTFLKLDSPISRLVPFPRLHFATASYASRNISEGSLDHMHYELNNLMFHKDNCFVTCKHDMYMNNFGYCISYRGLIDHNLDFIKQSFSFIKELNKAEAGKDYYYIENKRPLMHTTKHEIDLNSYDVIGVKNYSGIWTFWDEIIKKFDVHVQNKAEVKKLVDDGVQNGEFQECRESMAALINDYKTFQSAVKE